MAKRIFFLISVLFLISGMMAMPSQIMAQNGFFCNGDFESGDLECWYGEGDTGVADFNVISGSYSAFMTTAGSDDALSGNPAYNDMCSWLESGLAFPVNVPQAVNVSFKVRYKTDEDPGDVYCEDPFNAKLVTVGGTIELVVVETDGITPGPGATVKNMVTGAFIRPPMLAPFTCGEGLFACETPVFEVKKRLKYSSCEPVFLKFTICDRCDEDVDSAVFIDDVQITFEDKKDSLSSRGLGGPPVPCEGPVLSLIKKKKGR